MQAQDYERSIPRYHKEVKSAVLARHLPEKADVILDAGCGTGRFMPLIASHLTFNEEESRRVIVGIDISMESLLVAQEKAAYLKKGNISGLLIQASATEIPFKPNSFDLIVCSEMFEHILDRDEQLKLLKEFRAILKPGGRLVLSTYNYSLWDKVKGVPKIRIKSRGNKPNYIRFKRNEFYNLITSIFSPNEIIHCFGTLCFWGIPHRLLNPLYSYFGFIIRRIEKFIEKTPLSILFGHLLIVVVSKK